MELRFFKPSLRYKPGQWLLLNAPEVAPLQWHPFTITSSPFDPIHSVHIRIVGKFTRKLAEAIDVKGNSLRLKIDGPFGAPASDVFSYDRVVMIAGGIGITPWISILRTIFHGGKAGPPRVRRADLIWSCGRIETLAAFVPFLKALEDEFWDKDTNSSFLRVQIYVTEKLGPAEAESIMINSAGAVRDPVTDLFSGCIYGRPPYGKILTEIKTSLPQVRKAQIGVFFCGPAPVARNIAAACRNSSSESVSFAFRKEQF